MLELMKYCNNNFAYSTEPKTNIILKGNTLKGFRGVYVKGQYIMINNTVLNDGLYHIKDIDLETKTITINETFNDEEVQGGTILGLTIPKDFIELSQKIEEYKVKHKDDNNVVSESFEGYSYTKATNTNGTPQTAIDVYKERLNSYRRVFANRNFRRVY